MINPLVILTFLAVWSAASSYNRFRTRPANSEEVSYQMDDRDFNNNLTMAHYAPTSASAGSFSPERQAHIVSFSRNIAGSDSDSTSFTTSNGISSTHNVYLMRDRPSAYRDENGRSVESSGNIAMSGHTSHTSPEGTIVSVTWSAATQNQDPLQTVKVVDQRSKETIQAETYRQARQASLQYSSLYGGNNRDELTAD